MKDFIKWLEEENGYTQEVMEALSENDFYALYYHYLNGWGDDEYIEFKYEVFSRIKWAVSYEFKNERGEWVQDVLDNNGEGMTYDEAGDVVFHIMGDWQETRNERSIPFNKEAIA